jgi:hypothetical protein
MESRDGEVDEFDTYEWRDDAAYPIDQKIAAQQRSSADRAIGDALQGQWNQSDNYKRVEDDGR